MQDFLKAFEGLDRADTAKRIQKVSVLSTERVLHTRADNTESQTTITASKKKKCERINKDKKRVGKLVKKFLDAKMSGVVYTVNLFKHLEQK